MEYQNNITVIKPLGAKNNGKLHFAILVEYIELK
jgi:hypothetical protein